MRGAAALLVLALAAAADDKRVADLLAQASAEYEAAKETWNKFVFTANDVADAQLAEMLLHYDKAIELCQKACESTDVPEADTMLLRLARRTAQLRATVFAREMRVRAEQAAREKPEQGEPLPPAGKPAQGKPEPPEQKPVEAPPPAAAEPEAPRIPEILETKEQRSRGVQSARDFLMNFYFANRKRDALVDKCATCNGKGTVFLPYNDPKTQKTAKQECGGCRGAGYRLNEPVLRKGFWLCWTPMHRRAEQEKAQWEQRLAEYKKDPRLVPEFLTSLRITKLDYHGLWVDAEWEEKGTTADGKKFTREVSRRLVRAGRQWFFFDPERDKEMFEGKPEAD